MLSIKFIYYKMLEWENKDAFNQIHSLQNVRMDQDKDAWNQIHSLQNVREDQNKDRSNQIHSLHNVGMDKKEVSSRSHLLQNAEWIRI